MSLSWRHLIAAVAAAGALATLPRVHAETFSLALKRVDSASPTITGDSWESFLRTVNSQRFFMPFGEGVQTAQNEQLLREFSKIVKKQPEKYHAKHPLRAVASLGSNQYAFVLDDKEPNSGKYDRLLFDKNHNGDLTDDEPILAEKSDGPGIIAYRRVTFPRVDVKIEVEGVALEYAFRFSAYANAPKKGTCFVSASLDAAAYREGEITLDGKKHHLVLLDYNSDGRFDSQVKVSDNRWSDNMAVVPEIGDMLLVDPAREPQAQALFRHSSNESQHYVSKLLNVEGRFYEVRISPAGDQITLAGSKLALGQLSNPSGPFHAIVYGDHGFLKINSDGTKPSSLPEGEWKLLSYTIDRTALEQARQKDAKKEAAEKEKAAGAKKESGKKASLLQALAHAIGSSLTPEFSSVESSDGVRMTRVSARATRDYPPVKVTKGMTTVLPFGPPFKPVVKVNFKEGEGKVQLQMSLVGSSGEICEEMFANGQRPGTPEFTITDPKGKVVESGKFGYG